jgi:hypothetical protein
MQRRAEGVGPYLPRGILSGNTKDAAPQALRASSPRWGADASVLYLLYVCQAAVFQADIEDLVGADRRVKNVGHAFYILLLQFAIEPFAVSCFDQFCSKIRPS